MARFNQVVEFIQVNLDQSLSVEQLAEVACYSHWHFVRAFTGKFGVSPGKYVDYCRLKQAAYLLLFQPSNSVLDIALSVGYGSAEAFARRFKQQTGFTPTQFKHQADSETWPDYFQLPQFSLGANMQKSDVTLIEFPGIELAVMRHQGSPKLLHHTLNRFISWRKQHHTPPSQSRTFNILYDDPATVAEQDYRFDVGASIERPLSDADVDIESVTIPAMTCATLLHQGSWQSLAESVNWLFGQWLPNQHCQPADFPLFIERLNLYPTVPENQLQTRIFLPIKY